MGLLDYAKDFYEDYKQSLTGETDIICPKCGKSKLYLVDRTIGIAAAICPKCHFVLDNNIRNDDGKGPGAPSCGMLMN